MPRKTKGHLFKIGQNYYCEWTHCGKRHRLALRDSNGNPITQIRAAEEARAVLLARFVAGNEAATAEALAGWYVRADAKAAAIMAKAERAEIAARRPSIAAAWKSFLDSPHRPQPGEATLEQYQYQYASFVEWAGKSHQAAATLADITPEMAKDYAAHLRKRLAPGTAAKHLALLRLVYTTVENQIPCPFDITVVGKGQKVKQTHRDALSLTEIAALCDAAEGEFKTLIFLGAYTAQRLGDLALLDWGQVDLPSGWINFRQGKTDELLSIPMHANLLPILQAIPAPSRRGYVMPGIAADYLRNRDRVTDKLAVIFRRAKIDTYKPGTGPKTGKRAVLVKSFHSLRHSCNTLLLEAGIPPAVVQAITGHRTLAMQNRYTHAGRKAIEAAIKSLPAISGADKPIPVPEAEADLRARLRAAADSLPIQTVLRLLEEAGI